MRQIRLRLRRGHGGHGHSTGVTRHHAALIVEGSVSIIIAASVVQKFESWRARADWHRLCWGGPMTCHAPVVTRNPRALQLCPDMPALVQWHY